jgi:hypothetical protein
MKYRPGEKIKSLDELAAQEFVFGYHKLYHRGWVRAWQISFALSWIQRGALRRAEKIEEKDLRN